MSLQLAVGSAMMVLTIVIEAGFIIAGMSWLDHDRDKRRDLKPIRGIITLSGLTLWLLAGLTVVLWLWALLFLWIQEFSTLNDSLYFATVAATTLGFGDVLLSDEWQLLSGFIAANGLVLFSLNTAFLFEVLRGLHARR